MRTTQKRVAWPPKPDGKMEWEEWHTRWHNNGCVPSVLLSSCSFTITHWCEGCYFATAPDIVPRLIYSSGGTERNTANKETGEQGCKAMWAYGYNTQGVLHGPD